MIKLYFIHALDETTSFLSIFAKHFKENFFTINPNKESVEDSIKYLEEIPSKSIIIFLGHGHSSGLYTPQSDGFQKEIFINSEIANHIFKNHEVLLLSCNSNQFITKVTGFKSIIGFGNILSSKEELQIEAEHETGIYRNLSIHDIEYFNDSYCGAIINALKSLNSGIYKFTDIPKIIEFSINQKINETLLNKDIENRKEIAKLLFEFRNEMIIK